MNTMTETTTHERALDALSTGDALTLGELARVTGDRCDALRAALCASHHITSVMEQRGERRMRVFRATDAYMLREEGGLLLLAESASEESLADMGRARLRAAALAFDVEGLKVKDTKATLVAAILAKREGLFAVCACGEPVDAAGDVCEPCAETAETTAPINRSPRASRGTGTGTQRKPDVSLDAVSVDDLASIATDAPSSRSAQRDIAKALAANDANGFIDAETLRTLLRKFDRLSPPNFSVNMSKDGFVAIREGRKLLGWTLPQ